MCDSLLKRYETDTFLKRIRSGDEKWVVYDNVMRKRSWSKRDEPAQSTSKVDIHQKKVMLSVWWDLLFIFSCSQGTKLLINLTINQKINQKRVDSVFCL